MLKRLGMSFPSIKEETGSQAGYLGHLAMCPGVTALIPPLLEISLRSTWSRGSHVLTRLVVND